MNRWTLQLALLLAVTGNSWADTVDRIVVSVGNAGITQGEIDQEVRFAEFLDGQPQSATPSEAQRKEAQNRLVEQTLLADEAEADLPDQSGIEAEATRLLREVQNLYADESAYRSALAATEFTDQQVFLRLTVNVKIVRLINRRLRPNAVVDRREIETYYEKTFLPEFAQREKSPPPKLEDVETVIREILTQQKVDQLLDQWLKEIQITRRVKVHPK